MTLRILPLQAADLTELGELGHRVPSLWVHRLGEQTRNISVTLIARVDGALVGHAVLTWDGAPSPPLPQPIPDCPDVSDVWVAPDWRGNGIGTALMEAAEQIVRSQGLTQIGLSVGVENGLAAKLYVRQGYMNAGLPPFVEHGEWTAENGEVSRWEERSVYLIKPLA